MKRTFLFVFLYLIFQSSQHAITRAKNIPGVDPLPIAILEKEAPTQPTQKDTTTKTEETPTSKFPDFPKIRNLKVVPDPSYPFSARITWEISMNNDTPIYVVRYTRPISTRDILLSSYNLTNPPLPPNTTSFIDYDIPEGVYYYAAVTSFELSRDGVLILKPDVNYTINPFVVYRTERENKKEVSQTQTIESVDKSKLTSSDYEISELSAINTDKVVILNWKPLPIQNIKYRVYKGKEPLDSLERLKRSIFIGETIKPFFIDENPIEGEPFFYGVSVLDVDSNVEYASLKFQRSYINHTFKKQRIDYQYKEFLPDSLIAYQVDKTSIQLFWVDAGPGVKYYRVYRSNFPISSTKSLEDANYIGNAQSGRLGFIDRDLKPDRYFYAVFPVLSNENELRVFFPNRTFTTFSIIIPKYESSELKKDSEKPVEPVGKEEMVETESRRTNIKSISVKLEDKNSVRLIWDYYPELSSKIKVLIYRSPMQITKYEELKDKSIFIGEFPLVAGVYVDKNLPAGKYYYNFLEYNTDTNNITAFYYLKRPIEIQQEEVEIKTDEQRIINPRDQKALITEESKINVTNINQTQSLESENEKQTKTNQASLETKQEEPKKIKSKNPFDIKKEIQTIIDWIYKQKRYTDAEQKIRSLLSIQDLSDQEKGQLKFYYGVLLYRQNRLDEARRFFVDPDVQSFDAQRANFWLKRTLE
ncbi:MAG: hypothetical protein NZ853_05800 [Leptospiraceae bacterium]|nr:hypothetical protein [Leptospiraceae bacterium]MDW7976537.1 hypothetical protein [Leptospiraceae bacterium]